MHALGAGGMACRADAGGVAGLARLSMLVLQSLPACLPQTSPRWQPRCPHRSYHSGSIREDMGNVAQIGRKRKCTLHGVICGTLQQKCEDTYMGRALRPGRWLGQSLRLRSAFGGQHGGLPSISMLWNSNRHTVTA